MNLKIWISVSWMAASVFPVLVPASKILILTVFETKSMRNIFQPLATGLVSRGHDVTLIGMVPTKDGDDKKHGVKYRTVPGVWEAYDDLSDRMFNLTAKGLYVKAFFEYVLVEAEMFIQSDIHRDLYSLPDDYYDLAIMNGLINEFAYPIANKVAKNSMLVVPPDLVPWLAADMGIPWPDSFVPSPMVNETIIMPFFRRMLNAWTMFQMNFSWRYKMIPALNSKVHQLYPALPTIQAAQHNISVMLINAEPVFSIPRPSFPNVIHVGCIHCKLSQPLPQELAEFTESVGEEGFIVFSLGSVLKSSMMPPEMTQKFVNVLSRVKIPVIWKYEAQLKNLPSNVKLVKWIPQQDLLGHPKIRLFITHCGLLSVQEAVYHGVPVLGFPLFADQPGNAVRLEERRLGLTLPLHDFTEDQMLQAIQTLLMDHRYRESARTFSAITRDQIQQPLERAFYWVEYVIRHEGALHLRPIGSYLNFVQYYLLDVAAVILTGAVIAVWIIILLTRKVLRALMRQRTEHQKSN